MMARLCDRCGQPIDKKALRYVAKVQVFAAYDPLEMTFDELTRDHRGEINALLAQCAGLTEEELMRDVHVEFQFDLCGTCQKVYVANPLPAVAAGN
jgi:hypothetical protein